MDLSQVMLSTNDGPARVAIYGVEGSGKTTTACYFPKPIVIGAENGVPRDLGFTVPTIRPRRWKDLFDIIASLSADAHEYESVVLDTVDWIEPMIHEYVCERDSGRETEMNKKGKPLISIEDYGFGRGFLVAEEEFCRLIAALDVLQHRRQMNIVMLSHSKVKTFKNPAGPDFDRYELKCHERIASKVKEWAENLLFIHYRFDAGKISEDKERNKADPSRARAKAVETSETVRLVGCQQSALYDAKNRVRLPATIELTDPNELIAHLLGDHLRGNVAPIADPTARVPRSTVEHDNHPAVQRFRSEMSKVGVQPGDEKIAEAARAATSGSARADERANAKWGRDEQTMAMDAGRIADAVGVPAHHESRKADEDARREEALAKARASSPEPKAPARNEDDLIRKLTAALSRASVLGPQYRAKVDAWCSKAGGDPAKIDAIIRRIDENVAQAQQTASA